MVPGPDRARPVTGGGCADAAAVAGRRHRAVHAGLRGSGDARAARASCPTRRWWCARGGWCGARARTRWSGPGRRCWPRSRTRGCCWSATGPAGRTSSELAERLGVADSVIVTGGVPWEDVPAYFDAARRVRHAVPDPGLRAGGGGVRHRVPRGRCLRAAGGGGPLGRSAGDGACPERRGRWSTRGTRALWPASWSGCCPGPIVRSWSGRPAARRRALGAGTASPSGSRSSSKSSSGPAGSSRRRATASHGSVEAARRSSPAEDDHGQDHGHGDQRS